MRPDGVSGAGEARDIPKYEKPEDITWQEFGDSSKLSNMLAGIEASLDREIKNAKAENSEDGVNISQNEYNNIQKWYKRINMFYSQASQTANQTYNDFADKLKLTLDKIKKVIEKNEEKQAQDDRVSLRFSPNQQHIKKEFENIMNNIDYENADSFNLKSAKLGLENIIVKYKAYNNEDRKDSSKLSSSQIAKIQKMSTYIDKLATEREKQEAKKYANQTLGSSFYERNNNAQAYAKIMKEHGHSHNLRADLGVVLPEDEQ
jgi:hypothetical protein